MKSIDWLALTRLKMSRVLGIVAVVVFAFACSDGSEDLAGPPADASARKNNGAKHATTRMVIAKVSEEDYILEVLRRRYDLEVHNNVRPAQRQ